MSQRTFTRFEIESLDDLRQHLRSEGSLEDRVLHRLDLTECAELRSSNVAGSLMLGCRLTPEQRDDVEARGATVFPEFDGIPYNPYRHELYSAAELLSGYDDGGYTGTLDFRIYTHFDRARNRSGHNLPIRESLAQRIHDHAIDDALHEYVARHGQRRVVGIMGGHGTRRDDPDFRRVVLLCRELTQNGFLIATGGGPGIMEAGNLGAYLSNFEHDTVVDAALEILADAPKFDGGQAEGTPAYLEAVRAYIAAGYAARRALDSDEFASKYGKRGPAGRSLAVPTWFYGHEPSNLFCDHVAKYFSNGLREDVLLAVSRGGVVFAPGSAGTLQEVFMDLAQNHYATFVDRSPMVFLGREPFADVVQLIQGFIDKRNMGTVYGDMVACFDDPVEAAAFIEATPPRPRERKTPLYDLV